MESKEINRHIGEKYVSVLVTGGAGFIGSHLCEELARIRSLKVVSLDDFSAGKEKNLEALRSSANFKSVSGDITNEKALSALFDEHRFDIVFNNAASKKNICLKNPKRDLEVNARGTLNLLELCRNFQVKKVVHASTGSVYGEPKVIPQTEDHPLSPVSHYGVSKLAGERYVALYNKMYDLDTTILRYFHVYGPRQEYNEFGGVVAIFIRNLLKGERPVIFGDGTQERSFTYVRDIVKANLLAAVSEEASGEVFNCASGIKVTISWLAEAVIRHFGKSGSLKPSHAGWLPGDIKVFDVDNSKIRKLGIEFEKDFDAKLKETIALMHGYIV